MSEAITFSKDSDLSGLHLEQTCNGNVATPFFSFPLTDDEKLRPYNYDSRYHAVVARSKEAFAERLGIPKRQIMVTEKKQDGALWWRLTTVHKMDLPAPPQPKRPVLPENQGAIDV